MPDRPTLDPQRTALLVMDYQHGIVAQLADTDPLLDRVTSAVDDVRAHQQLRAHDLTTLVLAGLSTSGVVLSTVREAMDRDYQIVVLHDACDDPDPATHRFLTGTLFPAHTHVTSVGELDALWACG